MLGFKLFEFLQICMQNVSKGGECRLVGRGGGGEWEKKKIKKIGEKNKLLI
jgi:hypothetical protein